MFHIWLLKESSLTQKHLLSFSNSTGSKGLSSNNNCWAGTHDFHQPFNVKPFGVQSNAGANVFINAPFTQDGDLWVSFVQPENWPGRRWRLKGGRIIA